MNALQQWIARTKLQLKGKVHVVGWSMTPEEAISFFRGRGKIMLTFYGYSGMGYEDEQGMLQIARHVLNQYRPEKTLVMIGATSVGIGMLYRVAKANGFETAGIVSTQALADPTGISDAVDHVCFIEDEQWGGKLPNSNELSPTSKAMVACSDIIVAIGGNSISRDEVLEGKKQGKPVQYFPAEMKHEVMLRYAKRRGEPTPTSFFGSLHDVLGK